MNTEHRGLYAVLDLVALAIVGGITLHRHEAAATRWFTDGLNTPDTMLNQHPEDYNLIRLGFLTDKHELVPNSSVIATGTQWLNQQKTTKTDLKVVGA